MIKGWSNFLNSVQVRARVIARVIARLGLKAFVKVRDRFSR